MGVPVSSGGSQQVYAYDADGNEVGFDPTTAATTWLFANDGQFDPQTKITNHIARWRQGHRFLSLDPFAGNNSDPLSLHKYLYAHADTVNNIDPTGLRSLGELNVSVAIGNVLANLSARAAVFALNHTRLVAAGGFLLNVILPQDIQDAMVGSGIPPFQIAGSAGRTTKHALRTVLAFKHPRFTKFLQKYSASELGKLSRISGQFFEDALAKFMPGAETQVPVKIGRHTVDFVWEGWVVEAKSGKSVDTKQLKALVEFAKREGKTLVYYFLREPPASEISKVQNAGGNVISLYARND